MMSYLYNPSTGDAEARKSPGVQGQIVLHSEFIASLNSLVIPCLKTANKQSPYSMYS